MMEGKSEQKEIAVVFEHSLQILQKRTAMQTLCQGSSNTLQGCQVREKSEDSTSSASQEIHSWTHSHAFQRISAE